MGNALYAYLGAVIGLDRFVTYGADILHPVDVCPLASASLGRPALWRKLTQAEVMALSHGP